MAYTTTDLISAVKSLASIPTSQSLFSTSDFLRFANRALSMKLVPLLQSVREEYYVTEKDYAVTAAQASYRIPSRAVGAKLRDVKIIDGDYEYSLPRLDPEGVTSSTQGQRGFYLKANHVVLVPTPTTTDGTYLRLSYTRRPGTLVATTDCAQITSIDTGNNQVVVSSVPSTFTTSVEVDLIEGKPGFDWLATDKAITGVSGTTISFASLPTGLAEGDWLALAGKSPVMQIPLELHPILEQAVAVTCLSAQGKRSDAKAMDDELSVLMKDALNVLTPRIDGEPKKIVGRATLLNHFRRGF